MDSGATGPRDTSAAADSTSCVESPRDDTGPADTSSPTDTSTPTDTSRDTGTGHSGLPTIVYAVRHAEKASDSDDSGLTEEGEARAQALVGVLHDVPLVAVYATELRRTQKTVAPTAADHGLPVIVDLDPEEKLAAHLLSTHPGESVLHAGHSYTLPDFFRGLGVADAPYPSGYGELWIVCVYPDGEVTIEASRYGE